MYTHRHLTFAAGACVGASVGGFVWLAAGRFRLLPSKYARLGIVGAALFAYTLAGLLAAAVAGIMTGARDHLFLDSARAGD